MANARASGFFIGDFTTMALPRVDYVFASGAFGYRGEDPGFHGNMILRIYHAAEEGVAARAVQQKKSGCLPYRPVHAGQ